MSGPRRRRRVLFRPLLAWLTLCCCVSTLPLAALSGPDSRLVAMATAAGQKKPLLRIGLESAHALEISSNGSFRVLDPDGSPVWKERYDEPLQVVAAGGPRGEVPRVYRIQVGAYGEREAAQREADRLAREAGAPAVVHHDPDRGMWRVRLGEARERLKLNALMEKLRGMGLENLWIAEEPATRVAGVALRLVDASYDSKQTEVERLVVAPVGRARLSVGGTAYRGIVELRLSGYGTVQAINWIQLENYLLGVVPAELGPEVWPQLEALKAQAVAARTYVWRNLGQFEDDGYDLCATPRCQVYKGADAEHPLSDRAVAATRGEVLTYAGDPIDALYTATCGGHTEDGGNIFPDQDDPYLKGVPCRAEGDALETQSGRLAGRPQPPLVDETGTDVTRAWALLQSAGVIPPADGAVQAPTVVDAATLREWTGRLAAVSGRPRPAGEAGPAGDLAAVAEAVLTDLGWQERAEVLLSDEDLPALLRDPEARSLPAERKRALAYLAWIEAIRPRSDGRFGVAAPVSRARLAALLAAVAERYEAFDLRSGVVAAVGERRVRLVRGKGESRHAMAVSPRLFGRASGRPVPVSELELWPNDRVRYRLDGTGRIDFLELDAPVKGVSDDRSARLYSWETRKTRRQLESAINRRVSVGRLRDLQVEQRGVSGRVVALRVVGSDSSTVVRGFDVRRLLDLREILTVIEIQRDAAGEIVAAVFAGKGWGHGVGLCQVGAYGMALRDSTYREILAHYYRGTEIERQATRRPAP